MQCVCKALEGGMNLLFMSDIHVEPWYNISGDWDDVVSRYDNGSVDDMFECRNGDNDKSLCQLTGYADAPKPFWKSALVAYQLMADKRDLKHTLLFYGGDHQAHLFNQSVASDQLDTVPKLIRQVILESLQLVDADRIFITPGNNDGRHNMIFVGDGEYNMAVSSAWAQELIDHNIVTNRLNRLYRFGNDTFDSVSFFKMTGYYLKKVPTRSDSKYQYFVCTFVFYLKKKNNNNNDNNALESDIEFVKAQSPNARVLIFVHHPDVATSIVPSKYWGTDVLTGVWSGHVHQYHPTNQYGFTILPAITQYQGVYAAFCVGKFDGRGKVVLDEHNIWVYQGRSHAIPNPMCWVKLNNN
ncbi:hypothetical protein RFI_00300 [Reticulomyxa filosa]|uniref:Uncharacterized protein n=1 Tax=Reticulomyxa filosa TaxID=46433 RepID=X6PE22_RETFI|nr:hypothetical protein RFI_00300 [Reticulomyxa filosa]|eukprot:ETO36760.1 hypothetical protein RFI_00300 [Reticulomyxa filosa]